VLSPPDFLHNGGIEGFEALADSVFDDLLRLRRVVVLFDESEGFFKTRKSNEPLESRTTGAFITSGMLPRLQALHDNRWIVFVLATNSPLDELDEAVRRPGRGCREK
jgi:SpoVK/Ycf46/Vps4 family AAA+-type ATPase